MTDLDTATFLARVGQRADGVWIDLDTGEPLGRAAPLPARMPRARAAALDDARHMTAAAARRRLARIAALTARGWPHV